MSKPKSGEGKRWCFTINNPERDPLFSELPDGCRFIIWQRECGAEGTPHYQGYVAFHKSWKAKRVETLLGGKAFITQANGKETKCIEYCSKKDGTYVAGPWEFGTREKPGERTDLREIAKKVYETGKLPFKEHPDVVTRNFRGLQFLVNSREKPWRKDLQVFCIVGPTGIAKTTELFKRFKPYPYRVKYSSSGQAWFDGYQGEDCIIFDEFAGQIDIQNFNIYLEGFPDAVPIKGGFVPALWKFVFILSNRSPDDWYIEDTRIKRGIDAESRMRSLQTQLAALKRRIGMEPANGRYLSLPRIFGTAEEIESNRRQCELDLHSKLDEWGIMFITPDDEPAPKKKCANEEIPAEVDEVQVDDGRTGDGDKSIETMSVQDTSNPRTSDESSEDSRLDSQSDRHRKVAEGGYIRGDEDLLPVPISPETSESRYRDYNVFSERCRECNQQSTIKDGGTKIRCLNCGYVFTL